MYNPNFHIGIKEYNNLLKELSASNFSKKERDYILKLYISKEIYVRLNNAVNEMENKLNRDFINWMKKSSEGINAGL